MTPGKLMVVAYHKPKGLITTHADELGRETVYDRLRTLLPPSLARRPTACSPKASSRTTLWRSSAPVCP